MTLLPYRYGSAYFLQDIHDGVPMAPATVHINPQTHAKLKELADREGRSMPDILDTAVEAYRRQVFLEETNRAFSALKADPQAWSEEIAERAEWEVTLADGLEDDPR